MSRTKPDWYLAMLAEHARRKTIAELSEFFGTSKDSLRKLCKRHDIVCQPDLKGGAKTKPRKNQQLNAQESIALFKQQYKKSTINQLLTKPWSHHEQITTY